MKLFTSLGILALPASSSALALAKADPEPFCNQEGQACWKVARAAEAFADAIKSDGSLAARSPEIDFSHAPGGASFVAKRAVDNLANVIAVARDEPEGYYESLNLGSEFHADTVDKRDPEPNPWCTRPGASCKRDPEPAPKPNPDPWCTRPGASCKRDTKELKQSKREASPDPDPWCRRPGASCKRGEMEQDKRWCTRPGASCRKARRAAEAVIDAIGELDSAENSFAPDEKAKRAPEPWCTRPGASCKRDIESEKRWCNRPGASCRRAERDLHAMYHAARAVVDVTE